MGRIYGRIHSIETLGTHDGPGVRCVFFMAGCSFRCRFCHNPDTFTVKGSRKISLQEAEDKLRSLQFYLKASGGGVTASGGEPTLQPDFVRGLFKIAHSLGLTTVLDTNGSCKDSKRNGLLRVTNTVLLDIKASTDKTHKWLTGQHLKQTEDFGRFVSRLQKSKAAPELVIRRVLLPEINDTAKETAGFLKYLFSLAILPPVELIGYHKLGIHKWKELGLHYELAKLPAVTSIQLDRYRKFLEKQGLTMLNH